MAHDPRWRRYLRFWRPDPEADVDEELRTHLELRVAELEALGRAKPDAEREALEEFGDLEQTKRRLYEIGRRLERRQARHLWWDRIRADLRYALRGLIRAPLVSFTAVFTIAVAIGAATIMLGITRSLLIQPPPHVAAPQELRSLHFEYEHSDGTVQVFGFASYPFFELVRERAGTLTSVGTYAPRQQVPAGRGEDAVLAAATMVSAGFWQTVGTRAAVGRLITDDEAHPASGSHVVVVSHPFWQRHFGGDPAAIGRTLLVRGVPHEIIGVTPRNFRGVEQHATELWLPLRSYELEESSPTWHTFEGSSNLRFVARLRPEVAQSNVAGEIDRLYKGFFADFLVRRNRTGSSATLPRRAAHLVPVTGALGMDMQRVPEATVALWVSGVTVVLLAVACANVAGLLLLRALRRQREIAVRRALGMSRRRLAALLFSESALLAALGGATALLVVAVGAPAARSILLGVLLADAPPTDRWTLVVALACTIGAALATGFAPVLQTRRDDVGGLRDGEQHGAARRSPLFRLLLVGQTALSVLLLVGAGLFLRSLHRVTTVDLGMDVDRALAVVVDFTGTGRSDAARAAFFERALEQVRNVPGVLRATVAADTPLRSARGGSFRLPGASEPVTSSRGMPMMNSVGESFVATMGMRLLDGRDFTSADRSARDVLIVNESLARGAWPGRSPVGECVFLSARGSGERCTTVIGVVADARTFRIQEEQHLWFYTTLAPESAETSVLLVQSPPGVEPPAAAVRREVERLDPAAPFVHVMRMSDAFAPEIRPWRVGASIFTAVGVLTALLAAVGLYAALAYAVTQRTREIGVRMAVGASTRSVLGLVVSDGCALALAGVGVGILLALAIAPRIGDLLFQVSPHDPAVLGAVAALILVAATLASLVPARRAARIAPAEALRSE